LLTVGAFKLEAIFVINSVVVKAKTKSKGQGRGLRQDLKAQEKTKAWTLEVKAKAKDTKLCP